MVKLSNRRYEELKQIVVDTFARADIHCVPVNGFEIAARLGVSVCAYSSLSREKRTVAEKTDPDGFITYDSGKWVIYYDDKKPYRRINYTLMHEIWHAVLDHKETSEIAEAEAKFCAKYSLAPPVLIFKYQTLSIDEIVSLFDISYQAACNAFGYYQKWIRYGNRYYTSYEIQLCSLFGVL